VAAHFEFGERFGDLIGQISDQKVRRWRPGTGTSTASTGRAGVERVEGEHERPHFSVALSREGRMAISVP
jgi:hypothetical protein